MNEPVELTELEGLLRECRSLYASLSEKNARAVGPWPGMTEPIPPSPAGGDAENSAPNDFGLTLAHLQKQFLSSWRNLLQARVDLEVAGRERAREQSELARLSEQVMLLSQSRAEAAEAKNRLHRDLELRKIEVVESRETIERLQLDLAKRDKDLAVLTEQTALLEREKGEAEQREGLLTETLGDLESVKITLESRLEILERQINELRSKVEPVESELTLARSRIMELESALPREERERLENEVASLRAEKQSLESKFGDLKKQVESHEETRSENDRLALRIADLQERLSDAESRSAAASQSEKGLEVKLAASLTDLESYREQFNRLERENAKLKEELAAQLVGRPQAQPLPESTAVAALETEIPSPPHPVEEEVSDNSTRDTRTHSSSNFPYPEITPRGLEGLTGKKVLLVGGDIRFQVDYEHLFGMVDAGVDYFPSIIHLEKHGMKNAVHDSHLVVAFGGATQEPGLFRLRKICSDYGRYLLEHPSSGLVSLSHRLKQAVREL